MQSGLFFITTDNAPFDDIRVRLAMEYAIARPWICKPTQQIPIYQFSALGQEGYNPNIIPREYNLATAKKLLIEAGYPSGFKISLYYDESSIKNVSDISGYLAMIGVTTTLIMVDKSGVPVNSSQQIYSHGLRLFSFIVGSDKLDAVDTYFASTSPFLPQMGRPSELDNLIAQAKATGKNVQSRNSILQEINALIYDYVMYVPLWVKPQ